ncbi:MAG: hypothetical protein HY347_09645 [candidate division NC10 bacterium]|nr:hypothetical protein [candidate division NC10 bacterium]
MYDEEAVKAFQPVERIVQAFNLPLILQRKFTGILNAMEMQFEDGRWDERVLDALQSALLSLTDAVGVSHQRRDLEQALQRFRAHLRQRRSL